MEKSADAWEDGGRTSLEADTMQLRPLIGTVTSFDGDGGYINQTTYFPRYSLWEGTATRCAMYTKIMSLLTHIMLLHKLSLLYTPTVAIEP